MALSNQRVVSDGTLVTLDISFNFFERAEVSVYFDSAPQTEGPAPVGTWQWGSEANIIFDPAVAAGVEVLIQRKTDAAALRHEFSKGSEFRSDTLDENFQQVLNIVQEATESNFSKDFFDDIDMNGHQIKNLGPATQPNHAISLGEVQARSDTAWQAAVAAQQARDKSKDWATKATTVEGTLESAKTYSERAGVSATGAAASAASAQANAQNSSASAQSASASAGSALNQANIAEGHKNSAAASAATVTTKASEASASAASAAASAASVEPDKLVHQTSPTGVAMLPQGTPAQRPDPLPAGLLIQGDSEGKPVWYDRTTSSWRRFGSGGELFEVTWHNGPDSSMGYGRVPADGQTISFLQNPVVCQKVWAGEQNAVTEAEWQAGKKNCWSRGDGTSYVRVPNLNMSDGSAKPFYLRGGPAGLNGTWVGDAIRNIIAEVEVSSNSWGTVRQDGALLTGAFKKGRNLPNFAGGGQALASAGLAFDASLVVPTADENRVKTAYGRYAIRVFTDVMNSAAIDAGAVATQVQQLDNRVQQVEARPRALGDGQTRVFAPYPANAWITNTTGRVIIVGGVTVTTGAAQHIRLRVRASDAASIADVAMCTAPAAAWTISASGDVLPGEQFFIDSPVGFQRQASWAIQ